MNSVLEQAIEYYGKPHQQMKAIEELGELQQAILKALDDRLDLKNIIEEIADVEVTLAQLRMIFKIDPIELDVVKKQKILRLESRMVAK